MSELLLDNMRSLGRRLRLGIVGGGAGSGIGATHRYAARLDGKFEIVAGAFDIDPVRGRDFASGLLLDPARIYDDVDELVAGESEREDGVDLVSVLTPNHSHFAISAALVDAGFNVLCEKPLTTSWQDAAVLLDKVEKAGVVLAVNYGYSGYPMVRQAKAMCERGDFGRINLIQVEYALGFPATMEEQKGGHWRTKAGLAGNSAVLSMIGTHASHLASYVSGQDITEVSADLHTFVPGRELEDNAQINMRFSGGARGAMWASYVAAGAWHGLKLRIFGDKGGFEWLQEDPNHLLVHSLGGERKILTRGGVGMLPQSLAASRIAPAHAEGFIEAIGNVYSDVAEAVAGRLLKRSEKVPYPDHIDGALGVRFVDAAIQSSAEAGKWTPVSL